MSADVCGVISLSRENSDSVQRRSRPATTYRVHPNRSKRSKSSSQVLSGTNQRDPDDTISMSILVIHKYRMVLPHFNYLNIRATKKLNKSNYTIYYEPKFF